MTIRTYSFRLFGRTFIFTIAKSTSSEEEVRAKFVKNADDSKYVAVNRTKHWKLTFPEDIDKKEFYRWISDDAGLSRMRKAWINFALNKVDDEVLAHQYSQMDNLKWRDYLMYRFTAFVTEDDDLKNDEQ